jgi:hypothetical protein
MYNPTTGELTAIPAGVFYTVLVPNNAAIVAAANAGLLPKKTNGTPNIDNSSPAWSAADIELVNNFIKYHIINKNTIVPDGKKNGTYETTYKKPSGDPGTVLVSGGVNAMQITDNKGRKANVITANSNVLADRAVIHLIDNYLQYDPN